MIMTKVTKIIQEQVNLTNCFLYFQKVFKYPNAFRVFIPFILLNKTEILDFVLYRDVPPQIINILFELDDLFESEDHKAEFLLKKILMTDKHDFQSFSLINFQKLSPLCLHNLINHQYSEEIMKNINMRMSQTPEFTKYIDDLKNQYLEVSKAEISKHKELDQYKERQQAVNTELLKHSEYLYIMTIKKDYIIADLENACTICRNASNLFIKSIEDAEKAKNLRIHIEGLMSLSEKFYTAMDWFAGQKFANTIFPGSAKSAYDFSVELQTQIKGAECMLDGIIPSAASINATLAFLSDIESTIIKNMDIIRNM
ncbi:hypothetical protein TVAG_150080 [Trichomonas vaginalis G3]|uniref:Uncharacterized protein n=1 Tax=Trichomonas vaginalis (strain ATCC PRA-98 / G3) TaxID=412133 RepID=A2DRR0_TRIV3|nr:hypothetical protein TVAGG3_0979140 [Trichomonas vaginalis G3]EAY16857.1 hypothetical protein TVAG_150080 [Trichomonas vaginalis G3]KAI5489154.1 hypothetical protein TVAGG3_0979140 [Trichomonas vaginalis G3]|eukprot:XP_001329080.1 hypothetical protein [Trichomonas vaginalis G3]